MKSLIFATALIAVATAGTIQPGGAGPAPVAVDEYQPIDIGPAIVDSYEPINVGPVIVDYEPIQVGPAVVDSYEPIQVEPAVVDSYEPIQVGPAIVESPEPIEVGPVIVDKEVNAPKAPIVQIILNVHSFSQAVEVPEAAPINPTPVIIEEAENPIDNIQVIDVNPVPVEVIDVEAAEVGTPILPAPVITLPEELN